MSMWTSGFQEKKQRSDMSKKKTTNMEYKGFMPS